MTAQAWQPICPVAAVLPGTGVAARVRGHAVAVFHLPDGRVLAVGHTDPATGVPVLARGIVGDVDGEPTVAAPLHKQRYSLLDGRCLDDPALRIPAHPVRVVDGVVHVAVPDASPAVA